MQLRPILFAACILLFGLSAGVTTTQADFVTYGDLPTSAVGTSYRGFFEYFHDANTTFGVPALTAHGIDFPTQTASFDSNAYLTKSAELSFQLENAHGIRSISLSSTGVYSLLGQAKITMACRIDVAILEVNGAPVGEAYPFDYKYVAFSIPSGSMTSMPWNLQTVVDLDATLPPDQHVTKSLVYIEFGYGSEVGVGSRATTSVETMDIDVVAIPEPSSSVLSAVLILVVSLSVRNSRSTGR